MYVTKGYCEVTTRLRKEGTNISDAENRMVVMNLFMTITNANFDKEAIENRIHDTLHVKKELLKKVKDTSGLSEAALWDGSGDWEVIAGKVGVLSNPDEDIRSLQQLITYGIKGTLRLYQTCQCPDAYRSQSWMRLYRKLWQRHWITACRQRN